MLVFIEFRCKTMAIFPFDKNKSSFVRELVHCQDMIENVKAELENKMHLKKKKKFDQICKPREKLA